MPFCELARKRMAAITALAVSAIPLAAQTGGRADFALQGYYLGATSNPVNGVSGLAGHFQSFYPNVGMLSGSVESYMEGSRLRLGTNFLELRGVTWKTYRWSATAGDSLIPLWAGEPPASNLFVPDLAVRGVRIEAENQVRRISFFLGGETLLGGPRVPYRIGVNQKAMGVTVQQQVGERLLIGVRMMRLVNGPVPDEESFWVQRPVMAQGVIYNVAVQTQYKVRERFRLYQETILSHATAFDGKPLSTTSGGSFESERFSARANYARQGALYLPIAGFFSGDREGPFADVRFKLFHRLEFMANGSQYRNNLENDSKVKTYQTRSVSTGSSLQLPWKLYLSGQISSVDFRRWDPDPNEPALSRSRYWNVTLGRSFHNHNLRVTEREMVITNGGNRQKLVQREVEDAFLWRQFLFSGGAGLNQSQGAERKNTLVFRGSAQARIKKLNVYGHFQTANDLLNPVMFTANAVRSTTVGVSTALKSGFLLSFEGYRNSLNIALNPENIFLLESNGAGVSTALAGMNQWSVYFRLAKNFSWGGGLPTGGLDNFIRQQRPIVGSLEGFVFEKSSTGKFPAASAPVLLDGMRTAKTDATGRYYFPDVVEGQHSVTLAFNELPADYEGDHKLVEGVVVKPQKTTRVDLEVYRLAQIEGKVNGLEDTKLDSVLIRLLPTRQYTTPREDGTFTFYNVKEGDYKIEIDVTTLPEETRLTSPVRVPAMVRMGRETPGAEFTLEKIVVTKPVRRMTIPSKANTAPPPAAPIVPPAQKPAVSAPPSGTCGEWRGGKTVVKPCADLPIPAERWLAGERAPEKPAVSRKAPPPRKRPARSAASRPRAQKRG